jgi:mannosyltransferase OCH1-like enzyme
MLKKIPYNVKCIKEKKIKNKFEVYKNEGSDLFNIKIIYNDIYSCKIIIERIDKKDGWGQELKLRLYDINNKDSYVIYIGKSKKNIYNVDIKTNIKLIPLNNYDNLNIYDNIIKNIFQIKNNNIIENDDIKDIYYSLSTFNSSFTYIFFDNKEARSFIINNYDESYILTYDSIFNEIIKYDFFKYCYLYINGGFYFNFEESINDNLEDILKLLSDNKNNVLISNSLQYNNFIYSSCKNKLIKDTIDFMKDEILLKKNTFTYNNILLESNSVVFISENIFKKKSIETQLSNIYYKSIKILEKGYVYVYPYPESDTFDFIISDNTLLITRTDKKGGWGLFLKIKVILNNIEKYYEIGSSSEQIKIIKDDFFMK